MKFLNTHTYTPWPYTGSPRTRYKAIDVECKEIDRDRDSCAKMQVIPNSGNMLKINFYFQR